MTSALRERVEVLEEENRQLRDLLQCKHITAPAEWGLRKGEIIVFRQIVGNEIATLDRITAALWWDRPDGPPESAREIIAMRVVGLRHKVPGFREGVRSIRGLGYTLTNDARRTIKAALANSY